MPVASSSVGSPPPVETPPKDCAETLAGALDLIGRIANQIEALHTAGRLHLAIGRENLQDSDGPSKLTEPEPKRLISRDAPIPKTLQSHLPLELSTDLVEATQALRTLQIAIDPRQIDIYQLGTLAAQMICGIGCAEYVRSAKAKGRVPIELRPLLERAWSVERQPAFSDVAGFRRELQRLIHAPFSDIATPMAQQRDVGTDSSQTQPRNRPSELRLPARLSGFELQERIASGGMGDVYLGVDRTLGRQVAVKVLPAELARHPEFLERFYSEASAAARLLHPNVIPIYFIGEDAGRHFFVMPFIDGESLAGRLARQGRLSVTEALPIVDDVLAGLQTAHAQGLVHRDIKPGNILLDARTGRAIVADFGLVKSLGETGGRTATGVILGTVDYMAPEQGRGRPVDHRCDLYAVGVLLYQMLVGKLPFAAESSTGMIFQHVYERPTPLQELVADLPPALWAVISRLMAKSPEARYSTAELVRDDLDALRQNRSLPSGTDATDVERFWRPAASRPDDQPLTQIIAAPAFDNTPEPVSVVAVTGWKQKLQDWLSARRPEWVADLESTQQQVDGAVADYQRRRDRLRNLVREAESVLKGLEVQHRQDTGNEIEAAELSRLIASQADELGSMRLKLAQVDATLQRLRSQRDILNARLRVCRLRTGTRDPSNERARRVRWVAAALLLGLISAGFVCAIAVGLAPVDRNGELALFVERDVATVLIDDRIVTADPARATLSYPAGQHELRLNRSGELVTKRPLDIRGGRTTSVRVLAGANRELVLDIDGVLSRLQLPPVRSKPRNPIVEPDGEIVWQFASGLHAVAVMDVPSPRNGFQVVTGGDDGVVSVFPLSANGVLSPPQQLMGSLKPVRALSCSSRSNLIAAAGDDHSILIWRGDPTRSFVRQLEGHVQPVISLSFSHDGTRLLSVGRDQTLRVWNVENATEVEKYNLVAGTTAAWSGDDARVVVNNRPDAAHSSLVSLQRSTGKSRHLNAAHRDPTEAILLSDVGNLGFSLHGGKTPVRIWNSETGEQIGTLGKGVRHAAITPDGLQAVTLEGVAQQSHLTLWDTRIGRSVQQFPATNTVLAIAITRDGEFTATINGDNTLRIRRWNRLERSAAVFRVGAPVSCVGFTPDGAQIVAGTPSEFYLWQVEGHSEDRRIPMQAPISAFRFIRNGTDLLYATGAQNSATNIIGLRPTRLLNVFETSPGRYNSATFQGHSDSITSIDCSVNGNLFVSGSLDGAVCIWTEGQSMPQTTLTIGRPVKQVLFLPNPNNRLLVITEDGAGQLWDIASQQRLKAYPQIGARLRAAAISPDGKLLVSGGQDHMVQIWNAEAAELRSTLSGHASPVNSVAFVDRGRFVLSGSDDGTARFWNVTTRQEMAAFHGHTASIRSVAVSPRGDYGASGSDDGTVRLWRLPGSK